MRFWCVSPKKVTKNGNKMIRLCEAIPVAVMVTGNANYLSTPWDVIVRRYRQKRGHLVHPTVEDATHDFFSFIQSDPIFWNEEFSEQFIDWIAEKFFENICREIRDEDKRKPDGKLRRPAAFVKAFQKIAATIQKDRMKEGLCPQFKDYSFEQFQASANKIVRRFLSQKENKTKKGYPEDILEKIRPSFERTIWTALRTRFEDLPSATLIFAGFGQEQIYPSLVSAEVCEGFDRHVNYHIRPEDIVCINDDKPVAICPFAQKDVINSILCGVHKTWSQRAGDVFENIIYPGGAFQQSDSDEEPKFEFYRMLAEVETGDLERQFFTAETRLMDKNRKSWERGLKDSDLESMASLADCLIDLTGFHRILTFSTEGVGGPVDVAVISKNDGFTWLRRKSWYHNEGTMSV